MRILVATDAWNPQVNGVVRTLAMMAKAARASGFDVSFLAPQSFPTFAMPALGRSSSRRKAACSLPQARPGSLGPRICQQHQ
jgi:hypothetical protein